MQSLLYLSRAAVGVVERKGKQHLYYIYYRVCRNGPPRYPLLGTASAASGGGRGLGADSGGGGACRPSTCCRFESRCASFPSGGRFLSLSLSRPPPPGSLFAVEASLFAARLASRSLRSFSRRSAFDSNSCQSPSRLASLQKNVRMIKTGYHNTHIYGHPRRLGNMLGFTYSTACRGAGSSVVK